MELPHVSLFTEYVCVQHGLYGDDSLAVTDHHVFAALGDRGYRTAVFSDNPFVTMVDNGLRNGFDDVSAQTTAPFRDALDPISFAPNHGGEMDRWTYLRESIQRKQPLRSLVNGLVWKIEQEHPSLMPDTVYRGLYTTAGDHFDRFTEFMCDSHGPFAAVVNVMDAHSPYDSASEYDRWSDSLARKVRDERTVLNRLDGDRV